MANEQEDLRFITIKDAHGNIIFDGKDNRMNHYPALQKRPFWQFTAADCFKIIGLVFLIVKFYFGTTYDIRDLHNQDVLFKSAFAEQDKVNQKIFEYMSGHDIYLTQVTGRRFRGGLPVDPTYNGSKIGE